MTFLLDTNVISEAVKPRPDAAVMEWFASVEEDQLFLSVVSLAELRHGVERLPAGRRREALDIWLTHDLRARFEHRLLPIDSAIADVWGLLVARSRAAGRPVDAVDAFLAATAVQHQLTLVTRNISDFESIGIRLFHPCGRSG